MTSQLQPVVLCGGSGTRLWPLSREDFPKQFLSLNGNASLLDATLRRLGKLGSTDTPICVANISHCQLLGAALDRAAIARNIIFEPMQRNTAPAIAAAAAVAVAKNPGVVLVVMPADHVVEDDMRFAESIARAFAIAAQGWICVLGAEPTGPSPAFGYILQGEEIAAGCRRVARFAEKPDREKAVELVAAGALWNAGIVVAQANVVIAALRAHEPAVLAGVEAAILAGKRQPGEIELDADCFSRTPSISFDHAVLERHARVAVTRLDAGWRDVGSWTEVAQLFAPDARGNRVAGDATLIDSETSFIHSQHRRAVGLGLKDIIVVDTPDALLVAQRNSIGRLGEAVKLLQHADQGEALPQEPRQPNESVSPPASLHRPLVTRMRFQLGGALVTGVFFPMLLRWPDQIFNLQLTLLPSFVGAALAIAVGYAMLRQFIAYPGVQATACILPCLAAAFMLMALVMFSLRIEYSRYFILNSFLWSLGWLYGVFRFRSARPLLALIPGGNQRDLTAIAFARWLPLSGPGEIPGDIEGVVADLHSDLPADWQRFIARCVLAGIPVYDIKNVIESMTGRVEIEQLSENSFGSVLPSKFYLGVKRGLDVALAMLLLAPFALLMALAAICIRAEAPGPVFFNQPRMGFRGRVFTCHKLRSIVAGAGTGPHFTTDADARVTKVGRVIRKYRIDELPQIFNILKGEMSWIGPRPEALELARWHARDIPLYDYRHAVRPGISGWAQVNQGNVAEIKAASVKLQYDFYYIKNFSPWLDVLIALNTLKQIF